MTMTTYTVVENAGNENERDQKTFRNYFAAIRWIKKFYADEDEIERLHVGVRCCRDGQREYV